MAFDFKIPIVFVVQKKPWHWESLANSGKETARRGQYTTRIVLTIFQGNGKARLRLMGSHPGNPVPLSQYVHDFHLMAKT
jgi:hypothetical protein